MTNEEKFITEVNNIIESFKQQDINEQSLQLSFAIAVILMNRNNLTNQFNQLMNLVNDNYIEEPRNIIIT